MKPVQISDNALRVLESRYLLKNSVGEVVENPDQLFKRIAGHIAQAELKFGTSGHVAKWETIFYEIMSELKFLPNSPTIMNAGTAYGQLSACFVLPVGNSLESIFTTLKNAALIHQSGGGTGFNFSALSPKDDYISPGMGTASGPLSFIKIFNAATENIKQGGRRRGANMGILNIDHPDIELFIRSKKKSSALNNFNISVGIYDTFMDAILQNEKWELKHPSTRKVVKKVSAVKLWNAIIKNAWASGDPGLIFLDTINASNPTPAIGDIMCTNPCGEVPLLPYEACNLGSIDVSKFYSVEKGIDWNALEITIQASIRFLDNVVEINDYIIPEIKSMVIGNRKIGLGIMGWANLLILMEMPYASDAAIDLAKKLMSFIKEKSFNASVELAKERGVFKNWDKSIYSPGTPIRNSTRTSIAPTGTISIIADTSSSIEPIFALAMQRENVLGNQTLNSIHPLFIDYLKKKGLYTEEIIQYVIKNGTIVHSNLPQETKRIFETSLDIEPEWHLKHQIAFQEFTDNAVSKTINLPEHATVDDIGKAYMDAWKQKAKGITIYRYGSKQTQVLYKGISGGQSTCKVCAT